MISSRIGEIITISKLAVILIAIILLLLVASVQGKSSHSHASFGHASYASFSHDSYASDDHGSYAVANYGSHNLNQHSASSKINIQKSSEPIVTGDASSSTMIAAKSKDFMQNAISSTTEGTQIITNHPQNNQKSSEQIEEKISTSMAGMPASKEFGVGSKKFVVTALGSKKFVVTALGSKKFVITSLGSKKFVITALGSKKFVISS
jgi:hypothetical protein